MKVTSKQPRAFLGSGFASPAIIYFSCFIRNYIFLGVLLCSILGCRYSSSSPLQPTPAPQTKPSSQPASPSNSSPTNSDKGKCIFGKKSIDPMFISLTRLAMNEEKYVGKIVKIPGAVKMEAEDKFFVANREELNLGFMGGSHFYIDVEKIAVKGMRKTCSRKNVWVEAIVHKKQEISTYYPKGLLGYLEIIYIEEIDMTKPFVMESDPPPGRDHYTN